MMLIDTLRSKGISDERILNVMSYLPREDFVGSSFINRAYDDIALPISSGQTISQPYTVAFMTSLLQVREGDKILEIGTGSGYQACLLFLLGARVFTVERIQELYIEANMKFKTNGYQINTRFGDGSLGWKEFAPYDGIIVTAASPAAPESLKMQLGVGGRLVIPIGNKDTQTMFVIERMDESTFHEYQSDKFKFVPLIGKEGWEK